MRIAIYGNEHQDEHLEELNKLFLTLSHHNVWIEIEKNFYQYLCDKMTTPPKVDDVIAADNLPVSIASLI